MNLLTVWKTIDLFSYAFGHLVTLSPIMLCSPKFNRCGMCRSRNTEYGLNETKS